MAAFGKALECKGANLDELPPALAGEARVLRVPPDCLPAFVARGMKVMVDLMTQTGSFMFFLKSRTPRAQGVLFFPVRRPFSCRSRSLAWPTP